MATDAAALLEISEASIMTAWVTDLIDPLPGRSQLDKGMLWHEQFIHRNIHVCAHGAPT